MTKQEIINLINVTLQEKTTNGTILQKDLNGALRTRLPVGKKTKFKAREWKVYCSECATGLNIHIQKKK